MFLNQKLIWGNWPIEHRLWHASTLECRNYKYLWHSNISEEWISRLRFCKKLWLCFHGYIFLWCLFLNLGHRCEDEQFDEQSMLLLIHIFQRVSRLCHNTATRTVSTFYEMRQNNKSSLEWKCLIDLLLSMSPMFYVD